MLFHDYRKAWQAVQDAIKEIERIEFHSRDYCQGHPMGIVAWQVAKNERSEIYKSLKHVAAYLQEHAEYAFDKWKP
jgi:hypothetical protein